MVGMVSLMYIFISNNALMKLEDYRHLDCEANAHVLPTSSGTHHLHIPRRYDVRRLLRIVEREALDQLES